MLDDEQEQWNSEEPIETPELQDPEADMRAAFRAVMAFPEGRNVLRYLLAQTGFNEYVLNFNAATMEINVNTMIYNAARRDLWIDIRRMLTPDDINVLEMEVD